MPYVALGLWLAWVFVAFDSFSWLSDVETNGMYRMRFYSIHMGVLGAVLLAVSCVRRRFDLAFPQRATLLVGACVAALGGLLIVAAGPYYLRVFISLRSTQVLFYVGSALTGLGFVPIALCCMKEYAQLAPRKLILSTACSVLVAGCVLFAVVAMAGWKPIAGGPSYAGICGLVLLPLLAAGVAGLSPERHTAETRGKLMILQETSLVVPRAFWKLLVIVAVYSFTAGSIRGLVVDAYTLGVSSDLFRLVELLRMGMALVFAVVTIAMQKVNFGRLYSLIMVGATVFIVFAPIIGLLNPATLVLVELITSVFVFVLWCIAALIAHQRKMSSVFIMGGIFGAYALGMCMGAALSSQVLSSLVEAGGGFVLYIVLGALVLCCAFVLFSEREFDVLFEPVEEGGETIEQLFEREENLSEAAEAGKGDKRGKFRPAIEALAQEYKLSKRENDIFTNLAMGYNTEAIAEKLGISWNTVRTHTRNVYAKLGIHSKQELMILVDDAVESLKSKEK